MSVAWSSNDQEVIERSLEEHLNNSQSGIKEDANESEIKDIFEVERCVAWIKKHDLHNVTLQFPDKLLQYAPVVAKQLGESLNNRRVSVLGDTSYGDCCVDCVAAEHVGSDGLIHFGDTCFAPTDKLPVLYIFTQFSCLDVKDFLHELEILHTSHKLTKNIAIFYDVPYHHSVTSPLIKESKFDNLYICWPPNEEDGIESNKNEVENDANNDIYQNFSLQCGRRVPGKLIETIDLNSEDNPSCDGQKEWTIVYIGHSDIYSQYLALTFPRAQHYLYQTNKKIFLESSSNVTKALMRRYFAIEKTKDAERIGILVGTLGVVKYRDIIDKCRDIIKSAGKRQYTFLVGKPNAPKLANFPEIDVFVVVACPLNSIELVIGNISKGRDRSGAEFLRPIITPYELDVALNPKQAWTGGSFKARYQTILPGEKDCVERNELDHTSGDSCSDVSLITGKIRTSNLDGNSSRDYLQQREDTSIATQERQISLVHEGGGGQFLKDRSWQGLEQNLGNIPPAIAVKGQTGIATHYTPIENDS